MYRKVLTAYSILIRTENIKAQKQQSYELHPSCQNSADDNLFYEFRQNSANLIYC